MNVINQETMMSAKDFMLLPEGPPYFQLLNGKCTMSPSPFFIHQRIASDLLVEMSIHVKKQKLGIVLAAPMDVLFDEYTVLQPDILFISNQNRGIIKDEQRIIGSPDLVVEILSKNKVRDLTEKKYIYETCGVKEYWLIDSSKKTIEVLENQDMEFVQISFAKHTGTVFSKVLEGFSLDLTSILY